MSPIDSAVLASLHCVRHRLVRASRTTRCEPIVIEFGTFWVDCELLVVQSGSL